MKKYEPMALIGISRYRKYFPSLPDDIQRDMIQAAKRKARGYHTFEGFSSMIYLIAAKLELACPNPLRFSE